MPRRVLTALGLATILMAHWLPSTAAAGCEFVLGFKTMRELIPNVVGECVDSQSFDPGSGDAVQRTSTGLLVWRKLDNWTAFTNGARTWIIGPQGLQERDNTARFPWEAPPQVSAAPPPPPPPPTGKVLAIQENGADLAQVEVRARLEGMRRYVLRVSSNPPGADYKAVGQFMYCQPLCATQYVQFRGTTPKDTALEPFCPALSVWDAVISVQNSSGRGGVRAQIVDITTPGGALPSPTPCVAPPQPPDTQTFSGSGTQTAPVSLIQGLVIATATYSGPRDNFIVELKDSNGQDAGLLANEIGNSTTSRAIHVDFGGRYMMNVRSSGAWRVQIFNVPQLSNAPPVSGPITGKGTSTVPVSLRGGLLVAAASHDGKDNFIVELKDATGQDVALLANEIGKSRSSRSVAIGDTGVYIMAVQADGNWSVTLGQ